MKYSKIELGLATLLFLTCIGSIMGSYPTIAKAFPFMLMVSTTYVGFLTLNYFVLPQYLFKKRYFEGTGLTLSILVLTGLAFMVFFSYVNSYWYHHLSAFQAGLKFMVNGFAMAIGFLTIYAVYVLIREGIIYQYKLSREKQSLPSRVAREVILVFSIWLAVLIPCLILRGTGIARDFAPFYFFAIPYCIAMYFINVYWLIPRYKNSEDGSGLNYFFSVVGMSVAIGVLEMTLLSQTEYFSFFGHLIFSWMLPSLIVPAIAWSVYLTNQETYRKLSSLQTALGNTSANLQYLRSQINPHFLFNVLNTLYGTALMEKAEKTGEGIQKLGDMMRFMLHENYLDKIALNRELEYLHNYIDLQNMRVALSPDITIDIQIEEMDGYYEIAPMLLIPFIENAYKHGISLQAKSWINASLYKQGDVLHLDVHNSIHPAYLNDPERDQSGTGLPNVRQRLELVYPGRHELVVRQNTKEFFVHLSITLNTIKTL